MRPEDRELWETLGTAARALYARLKGDHGATFPPGLQVGVAHAGRLVYTEAFGVADTLMQTPLTPHAVFRAASQTKPLTAAVAMSLVDRGLCSLDEPIWPRLCPWIPTPEQCAGFDPSPTTLRMILAHAGGWDLYGFSLLPPYDPQPTAIEILSGCFGPRLTPRLTFAPGTSVQYSGTSLLIAQTIIEHLTKRPFPEVFYDTLIRPTGLTHTWAGWQPGQEPMTVRGHQDLVDPLPLMTFPAVGTSGVFSTAADLAVLYSRVACFDRSAALLSPRATMEMTRPQFPSPEPHFAIGFVVTRRRAFSICKHHGWGNGFFMFTKGSPQLSCAVSVQCNADGPISKQLTEEMSEALFSVMVKRLRPILATQVEFAPASDFQPAADELANTHIVRIRAALSNADIHHVGSTTIPGSLTKGDVDLVVRVKPADFPAAERTLAAMYARNAGSTRTSDFSAFEAPDEPLPLGVQLTAINGPCDDFLKQQALLHSRSDLLNAYNDLKIQYHGQNHTEYRKAKADFFERTIGPLLQR